MHICSKHFKFMCVQYAFLCILCVCMSLQRPNESVRYPGTRVAGNCGSLHRYWNLTEIQYKNSKSRVVPSLQTWIFSRPIFHYILIIILHDIIASCFAYMLFSFFVNLTQAKSHLRRENINWGIASNRLPCKHGLWGIFIE